MKKSVVLRPCRITIAEQRIALNSIAKLQARPEWVGY